MTDTSIGDVTHLSFENAIDELESLVKRLESGVSETKETRAIRARSEALRRHCMDLIVTIPGC